MFDRAPVGVGPRAAAFLLDLAFVVLIILAVWGLAGGVNQTAENNTSLTDPNTGASLVIAIALLVYFGGLESAWHGSTVGKRLIGLRVAMLDGSPLTGRAVLMRTVGRFFDCSLFSPIVAAVFVWASPHNQRLGDRWGRTIVIRTGRRLF
jgi:uncharacterized RDD family membrane protein YckC